MSLWTVRLCCSMLYQVNDGVCFVCCAEFHSAQHTAHTPQSVKVRRYELCGYVAACYIKSMVVCVLCAVQNETLQSTQHTHHHR